MAAGILGYDNKRNLGLIGMHGSIAANRAVDRADLIIALGARFSDRVALNPEKFGKKAHKIQVDIDTSEINKNVLVDVGISADIKEFLTALLPLIKKNDHADWVSQSTEWKKKTGDVKSQDAELHPSEIIQSICDMTDKENDLCNRRWSASDVGRSVPPAREDRRLHYKRRSGNHGIRLRRRHRRTDRMSGKESHPFHRRRLLHLNLNEACTAVSQDLPIITVIMNNRVLGMVYQWQTSFYGKRYAATTPERKTNFPKLAEAFGAKGFSASNPAEFEEVFKKALQEKGPVWIDCAISREERVLPMIPGGGTIEDMIIG